MQQTVRSNCLYLRTKVAYTPYPEGKEVWRIGESPTSCYWCLRTMSTIGPDENFVAPEVCQTQRFCYEDLDSPNP